MRETKQARVALRMANRVGFIINDVQISKIVKDKTSKLVFMERFKQIKETSSFDEKPPNQMSQIEINKLIKGMPTKK